MGTFHDAHSCSALTVALYIAEFWSFFVVFTRFPLFDNVGKVFGKCFLTLLDPSLQLRSVKFSSFRLDGVLAQAALGRKRANGCRTVVRKCCSHNRGKLV